MMDIGKRIKKIRTTKGMTQSELAGDQITRNMLSRIENGFATPSVATIIYIAQRLGVPAGYFLCEPENDLPFRKMLCMDRIKKAYAGGEYKKCIEICRDDLNEYDDEIYAILAECHFRLGRELFGNDRPKSAQKEFLASLAYAEKTLYNVEWIRIASNVHLEFLGELFPALRTEAKGSYNSETNALIFTDLHRYVDAKRKIENGDDVCTTDFEDFVLAHHIDAKIKMKKGDYEGALVSLNAARSLIGSKKYGAMLLFSLYSDIEVCFRETKDFEHAYEYATKKAELLPDIEKQK